MEKAYKKQMEKAEFRDKANSTIFDAEVWNKSGAGLPLSYINSGKNIGPDLELDTSKFNHEDYENMRGESVSYETQSRVPVRNMGKTEAALYSQIMNKALSKGLDYGADVVNDVGKRAAEVDYGAVSVTLGEAQRPINDPLTERQGRDISMHEVGNAFSFDATYYRRAGVKSKAEIPSAKMKKNEKILGKRSWSGNNVDYDL